MKDKIIHKSETAIYFTLSIILLAYIVFQIIDLVFEFYNAITTYNFGNPDIIDKNVFSTVVEIFFNVLISLEILETFKDHENDVLYKAKIVLLIAITAVTRKIITLDFKHAEFMTNVGIAALILSLTLGYFFVSKIEKSKGN